MDQVPSPIPSPAAYDHLQAPKLLASLYQREGFLHPALSHPFALPPHLQSLQDTFRPRSGSLLSLGSTGSSHRPERSPSRESTSSHDSLTRASPLGYIPDSPSPSPPNESSKLLGILKGTVSSPFSALFNKQTAIKSEMPVRRPAMNLEMRDMTNSRKPYAMEMVPRKLLPPRELIHRSLSVHETPLKRPHEDGPIDLSCKPKRPRCSTFGSISHLRRFPPPSETVTRSSLQATDNPMPVLEPISPPSRAPSRDSVASHGSIDDSSILRSILCGGSLNNGGHSSPEDSYPSRPASVKSEASGMLCPSPALSEPSSPTNSILSRLMGGSPCNVEANQRVGIAKKTLFPVRARVTFWLAKILEFAKSLPEFSSLCEEDQLIIVTNTWAKMLVVYMAENNFEFAVSPVVDTEGVGAGDTGNPEVPTMKGVEKVQNFVHKVHAMGMDNTEFTHFRTAVLFQIGNCGVKAKALVDNASSKARQSLQKHVQDTRPGEKLRYSNILLKLHALSGINNKMVQNLFCKHITSQVSMEDYVKDLLFEKTPVAGEKDN